jgi:ABC-2 type transport system permease protein
VTPQPLSLLRLLRHDLTLSWRRLCGFLRAKSNSRALVFLGLVSAGIHLAALPLARALIEREASEGRFAMLGLGFVIILPWLFSQGLTGSTRALYSRGDLDLLLSSPLAPGKILAARALAVAIEGFGAVGMFLLPVVDVTAWLDGAHWLAIYPALAATVLLATGLSLAGTLGLFRLLGPKRTRAASQVLATLVGAWFVICAQIFNFLPDSTRDALRQAVAHPVVGGWADPTTPLWLPARAAAGDPVALLLWLVLGLAVFALAVRCLARAFTRGALIAAGDAQTRRRVAKDAHFRCERGGALRRKEWRLLARDPYLLSQVLLQSLYTLPVALVIWKSLGPDGSLALSVAPALVAIAAQLAAALAFLAASSEDAGDFVATAPVAARVILRHKIEAIAAPVALFLLIPMLGVVWADRRIGLVTLAFACVAAGSTASLNFWKPLKNKRGDLIKTHAQNKLVGLVEHGLSLCWAIAALLAGLGQWVAVLPVLAALVLLGLNAPRRDRPAA